MTSLVRGAAVRRALLALSALAVTAAVMAVLPAGPQDPLPTASALSRAPGATSLPDGRGDVEVFDRFGGPPATEGELRALHRVDLHGYSLRVGRTRVPWLRLTFHADGVHRRKGRVAQTYGAVLANRARVWTRLGHGEPRVSLTASDARRCPSGTVGVDLVDDVVTLTVPLTCLASERPRLRRPRVQAYSMSTVTIDGATAAQGLDLGRTSRRIRLGPARP